MSDYKEESPFNPLPPIVVALALMIFGVELTFYLGNSGRISGPQAVGWRLDAMREYAFSGAGSELDDRNRSLAA